MSESQGGAGRREVAYRLFASEFDDADFSYSESDEERAPNYVVTPTGARVNRLFVVGVLTEIETVSEDYLRARVVDPTGPFVIYAGQYQPDALAFLERADPPAFVAVTGKARTYQPDDSDQVFTSVRPESISEVDAATRDRWVVQTAEQTVDRVARMAEAKQSGLSDDDLRRALDAHDVEEGLASGISLALDHYGTTGDYLAAMRELALDSARVVAGEIDEVEASLVAPDAGGDDAVASLVERPIDADAIEAATESDDGGEASGTASDTADEETIAAEAGGGNGSAIGTAASSGTAGSDGDEADDGVTADADAAAATESQVEEPSQSSGDETSETSADITDATAVDETTEDESTVAQTTDDPQATTSADEPGGEAATVESGSPSDVGESVTESDAGDGTDASDAAESSDADDLEDFEPEFELDEDEREEIEEEFGTEFQSGSEVDEPGAADIETPESESDESPTEPSEDAPADEEATSGGEAEVATESGSGEDVDESGDVVETESADEVELEDVDLEDAVMDAMQDLDEGDGAARDDVLAAVVDRTGADPGDVEDAIQDALMGGRCYEPDDQTLKPI